MSLVTQGYGSETAGIVTQGYGEILFALIAAIKEFVVASRNKDFIVSNRN